jgi:hypothetical protein
MLNQERRMEIEHQRLYRYNTGRRRGSIDTSVAIAGAAESGLGNDR